MYIVHTELRVLVCTLESENTDLVKVSNDQLQKLDLSGLGGTSEVHVPQYKPLTRSQYDHVSQLWPTHFHEDKKYYFKGFSTMDCLS